MLSCGHSFEPYFDLLDTFLERFGTFWDTFWTHLGHLGTFSEFGSYLKSFETYLEILKLFWNFLVLLWNMMENFLHSQTIEKVIGHRLRNLPQSALAYYGVALLIRLPHSRIFLLLWDTNQSIASQLKSMNFAALWNLNLDAKGWTSWRAEIGLVSTLSFAHFFARNELKKNCNFACRYNSPLKRIILDL